MIKSERNKSGLLCYWDETLNASKIKSPKESIEQKQLNSGCLYRWPEYSQMMFHVINESGGSGDSRYGSELNRMGRKKGVPDWPVMIPSGKYHGFYIELKRSRKSDSSTSKEQKTFLTQAELIGYKCVIAYGYKAALHAIEEYLK